MDARVPLEEAPSAGGDGSCQRHLFQRLHGADSNPLKFFLPFDLWKKPRPCRYPSSCSRFTLALLHRTLVCLFSGKRKTAKVQHFKKP